MTRLRISPPRIEPAHPGDEFEFARVGSGSIAQAMERAFGNFWTARWKQCPFCAERIRREAVFCKHCRHDLVG